MSHEDFPVTYSDKPHACLDTLPYAIRVGELIHEPRALERWRKLCHESYLENCQRLKRHEVWEEKRRDYAEKEFCKGIAVSQEQPAEGWHYAHVVRVSPDRSKTVSGWFPPEFGPDEEPYYGGPIPFSQEHRHSLADCYFIMALIHDAARRDGHRINPFDPDKKKSFDDEKESIFWIERTKHLADLLASDKVTVAECLRRIEDDIKAEADLNDDRGGKPSDNGGKRTKRSTNSGDAQEKLISTLTMHHKYADGSCLNPEPIGSNALARLAKVSNGSASHFFKAQFGEKNAHAKYRALCCNKPKLIAFLKNLNREFTPDVLYGGTPFERGEKGHDDEGQ